MSVKRATARNITAYRVRVGMTKSQLAKAVKMDPAEITKIERGGRNLTLEVLERIAKALGVRVADLVNTEPDVQPAPAPDPLTTAIEMMLSAADLLQGARRR